jgi:hypothetical protein
VNTPCLVEALVGGLTACDDAAEAYPQLEVLRGRAGWGCAHGGAPLQWLLLTVDLPLARALLRHTAQALLRLLDVADVAWATDAIDEAGKFRAILNAPPWVLQPAGLDDRDEDVALVLERDADYHGNWYALLEALHQAGSAEWQGAIRRCRAMMRFESATGLDVADVLGLRAESDDRGINPAAIIADADTLRSD